MSSTGDLDTARAIPGPDAEWTAEQVRLLAARTSPDPLPDSAATSSAVWDWLYRRTDFECSLLGRVVRRGFAANRFVHYAENFAKPASTVEFRWRGSSGARTLRLRSSGVIVAEIDGAPVPIESTGEPGVWAVAAVPGIVVRVSTRADEPAALATAIGDDELGMTEWKSRRSTADGGWEPVLARRGGLEPPHNQSLPTTRVRPQLRGDVWELEAPILGRVTLISSRRPAIRTGESMAEVLADSVDSETRHDLVHLGGDRWRSAHELGFAYLRVTSGRVDDVYVDASTPPIATRGAFVCSDDTLNRIWTHSAYTVRLCMQGLMVDGIKRDRMPWAGDQSLSTIANAFAFAARDVARDSIVALGEPTHGYVNGISDYSLWWVITSELYMQYFGDSAHLRREADSLHRFMRDLADHADAQGLFHPSSQSDGFVDATAGSVFVDWEVEIEPGRVYVPLQLLWFWSLDSAARLLDRVRHPGANRWRALAATVLATLRNAAWCDDHNGWREYLDGPVSEAPHAHAFGVLSGATSAADLPAAAEHLGRHERAGTPFMTTFVLRALAAAGEPATAVRRVRELWGGMLDQGAKTFWEDFVADDGDLYSMYGRPFGRSLCHAWGAGPAAVLPEGVLGLRPARDGWRSFDVSPNLGDLEWAAAVVPTSFGPITVNVDRDRIAVDVPAHTTANIEGVAFPGPQTAVVRRGEAPSAEPPVDAIARRAV